MRRKAVGISPHCIRRKNHWHDKPAFLRARVFGTARGRIGGRPAGRRIFFAIKKVFRFHQQHFQSLGQGMKIRIGQHNRFHIAHFRCVWTQNRRQRSMKPVKIQRKRSVNRIREREVFRVLVRYAARACDSKRRSYRFQNLRWRVPFAPLTSAREGTRMGSI